jgi:hypothetical protein
MDSDPDSLDMLDPDLDPHAINPVRTKERNQRLRKEKEIEKR